MKRVAAAASQAAFVWSRRESNDQIFFSTRGMIFIIVVVLAATLIAVCIELKKSLPDGK